MPGNPNNIVSDLKFGNLDLAVCFGGEGGLSYAAYDTKLVLMRFYDPTAGHVFVDGKDVRTYDKDTLHRM